MRQRVNIYVTLPPDSSENPATDLLVGIEYSHKIKPFYKK